MANKIQYGGPEGVPVRYVDIGGDGSEYAIAVSDVGSGGGGGTAVAIADGDFETFGAKADPAATSDTETTTYMSLFKYFLQKVTDLRNAFPPALSPSGNFKVSIEENGASVFNQVHGIASDGQDATNINPLILGLKTDESLTSSLIAGPNGSMPVYMADPSLHMGKVGNTRKIVQDSFTRPLNTDVYIAGDCISSTVAPSILDFSSAGRITGGSGIVDGVLLTDSANQATKADLELWLFGSAPAIRADGDPFELSDNETNTLLGVIYFGAPVVTNSTSGAGGNCVYFSGQTGFSLTRGGGISFVCPEGSTSIFGLLVVRNAYTPVANEIFTIRLFVRQD